MSAAAGPRSSAARTKMPLVHGVDGVRPDWRGAGATTTSHAAAGAKCYASRQEIRRNSIGRAHVCFTQGRPITLNMKHVRSQVSGFDGGRDGRGEARLLVRFSGLLCRAVAGLFFPGADFQSAAKPSMKDLVQEFFIAPPSKRVTYEGLAVHGLAARDRAAYLFDQPLCAKAGGGLQCASMTPSNRSRRQDGAILAELDVESLPGTLVAKAGSRDPADPRGSAGLCVRPRR